MEEKKREFKAVSMRFTKEEFEKMDKTGMTVYEIFDFDKNPFLVNDYLNQKLLITNLATHNKIARRTVIEKCDPKLFRQFCGLENELKDQIKAKMRPVFTPLPINFLKCSDEQKKIHDEMNECGKKPSVFSRVISEKDFSTPFFKDLLSQLREKEMSDEMKHATNLEAAVRIYIDEPIECDNEPKTFNAKDVQFKSHDGTWVDCGSNSTLRFKPKPTPEESLSAEIESLSEKAKGLGLKATVLFEKS